MEPVISPELIVLNLSLTFDTTSTSQNTKDDGNNYTGQLPNDATIKVFTVNL